MSKSGTIEAAPQTDGAVNAEVFIGNAKAYKAVRPLVDALVRLGATKVDKPVNAEDLFAQATDVIDRLMRMSENGASYTPAAELEFGSDNAATIAEKILGRSASAGAVRTAFAKLG